MEDKKIDPGTPVAETQSPEPFDLDAWRAAMVSGLGSMVNGLSQVDADDHPALIKAARLLSDPNYDDRPLIDRVIGAWGDYLDQNPEVRQALLMALVHYAQNIIKGSPPSPSPHFDVYQVPVGGSPIRVTHRRVVGLSGKAFTQAEHPYVEDDAGNTHAYRSMPLLIEDWVPVMGRGVSPGIPGVVQQAPAPAISPYEAYVHARVNIATGQIEDILVYSEKAPTTDGTHRFVELDYDSSNVSFEEARRRAIEHFISRYPDLAARFNVTLTAL